LKIAVLSLTYGGEKLAARLVSGLRGAELLPRQNSLKAAFADNWQNFDGFICIMSTGIVVRAIAELLENKKSDPCVVVTDEKGKNIISLLSGHLGGGNELALRVAALTGGNPVITTASDVLGLTSLDLWFNSQNVLPSNDNVLTRASMRLVNSKKIKLFTDITVLSLPQDIIKIDKAEQADIIISSSTKWPKNALLFHPKEFVLGIGCNRGVQCTEIDDALEETSSLLNISRLSIRNLASIDLKKDEEGLLEFAKINNLTIDFYTNKQLNSVKATRPSQTVFKATGAVGVAEPAALLSAGNNELFMEKGKWQNVTLALARANFTLSAPVLEARNI